MMDYVLAVKLDTGLLAQARSVTNGTEFLLILIDGINLISLFGNTFRLEARKTFLFTSNSSTWVLAFQDLGT